MIYRARLLSKPSGWRSSTKPTDAGASVKAGAKSKKPKAAAAAAPAPATTAGTTNAVVNTEPGVDAGDFQRDEIVFRGGKVRFLYRNFVSFLISAGSS
jgi:hypothetical protein